MFASSSTITVIDRGTEAFMEYLVVGGGGGGAAHRVTGAAGSGAGGRVKEGTASIHEETFYVTVGAGGAGVSTAGALNGNYGNYSSFDSFVTAAGGGCGWVVGSTPGTQYDTAGSIGATNDFTGLGYYVNGIHTSSGYSYHGTDRAAGGAAGALFDGVNAAAYGTGGTGGMGVLSSIDGTSTYYGGGGGGSGTGWYGAGGAGGGANGVYGSSGGNPGTGYGGGGSGGRSFGGAGFQGIVIVRYPLAP